MRALFLLAAISTAACQSSGDGPPRQADHEDVATHDSAAIRAALDELYRAFCFDPRGEADWGVIRQVTAPGAAFFAPVSDGTSPRGVGVEQFVADFQSFIRSSPLGTTGYHERILCAQVTSFGTIAHALVTFEGFVPGELPDRRGVDSVQFVLDGERWLVASFTTQYESRLSPIPGVLLPAQSP